MGSWVCRFAAIGILGLCAAGALAPAPAQAEPGSGPEAVAPDANPYGVGRLAAARG